MNLQKSLNWLKGFGCKFRFSSTVSRLSRRGRLLKRITMNEINNFLEATGRAVLLGVRWIVTVVCVGMFVFLVINLITLIIKAV